MTSQAEHANQFKKLHVKGKPVILYNVWDAGSANAVASAGAKAIATGSAPVAMANGFGDGEKISLELALENITRIVGSVDLPVSMDIEGGYGVTPQEVATTFEKAVKAGAVGFNFEDQIIGGEGLHDIETQSLRIKAAREAIDKTGINAFINARTDIFLKAKMANQEITSEMLDEAIKRAHAYEQAGADGFFAPALLNIDMIAELCEKVELPVNIIALPGTPSNADLAKAGVARISYGPVPYKKMISWFEEQAKQVFTEL